MLLGVFRGSFSPVVLGTVSATWLLLHLKLFFRMGSNYHGFHPPWSWCQHQSYFTTIPVMPNPIPRGVGEFGHLHRSWYVHLTPHWAKDTAHTCCQKQCNVLHPKQTRAGGFVRLWLDRVSSADASCGMKAPITLPFQHTSASPQWCSLVPVQSVLG